MLMLLLWLLDGSSCFADENGFGFSTSFFESGGHERDGGARVESGIYRSRIFRDSIGVSKKELAEL